MDYINNTIEQKYSVQLLKEIYKKNNEIGFVLFWQPEYNNNGRLSNGCLSQWHISTFVVDGITYNCMEQFMMAAKAKLFGDNCIFEEIMQCTDPKTIKALGRKVHNFDDAVWNRQKYTVVYCGNLAKFSQNKDLGKYLLSTKGKILAEASPFDGIWGIKMSEKTAGINNPENWKGLNLLGCALMQVRDELENEK